MVRSEGGQLERSRLFTNMLSSMPLAFNVFGHLRAHPRAAVRVLSTLTGRDLAAPETVTIGRRTIQGIECEWAPERREHLDDGTAFDAVVAARLEGGQKILIAVEVKYIDTFSRDPLDKSGEKDRKYGDLCRDFGMADSAFEALKGHDTRQLLRNVLLGAESDEPVLVEVRAARRWSVQSFRLAAPAALRASQTRRYGISLIPYRAMAMTLRTDDELETALAALAEAEGTSRQEIVRRAVLERYARSGHVARVQESSARLVDRWGDVLDRLGTV